MGDSSKPVPSPCVRNCCLDDQDMCLGCFRSLTEILGWSGYSLEERKRVLVKIEHRKQQRSHRLP